MHSLVKSLILAATSLLGLGATEVSILGYHEFTEKGRPTQMRMRVDEFRRQMQSIKDAGIEVISMEEFLAWKRGEKELPEQAILITIDDGWKSVYTQAYPILKEFNFPFTVFLYTRYIDVGGRSMKSEMIEEMIQNGCTIGSHSINHPYPSKVRAAKRRGPAAMKAFLDQEMGESLKILQQKFGDAVSPTYAYPGGFHLPEMHEAASRYDYSALFTVMPRMVTFETPDYEIPRFIVLGTHRSTFERALRFKSGIYDPKAPRIFPGRKAHITNREPLIRIEFPSSVRVKPDSVRLTISELSDLELDWSPNKRIATYQVGSPLRSPSYDASLTYQAVGSNKAKTLNWTFYIDREINYVPEIDLADGLPEPEMEPSVDR